MTSSEQSPATQHPEAHLLLRPVTSRVPSQRNPTTHARRDYFRRIEERQAQAATAASEGDDATPGVPSVARFTPDQIEALPRVLFEEAGASYSECSVCLGDFEEGELLTRLPCAAGHLLHVGCAAECLSRSTLCPLCRVDLEPIVPTSAEPPSGEAAEAAEADELAPPLSPRQLGFTRDGGVILRYEPTPPPEMPRPNYIPLESRGVASFVEIQYPERGVARVWRVPRAPETPA